METRERVEVGFRFSQSSLSAFDACRRRFWLRYLRRLEWPAALTITDQWEEAIRRGKTFHQWAQQEALGLDLEETVDHCGDELLQRWWRNYREQPPAGVPRGTPLAEVQLTAPLGDCWLLARFDRVVIGEDGQAVIFDWKTGLKRPEQRIHAASWQTLVYRYVLAEAGQVLNGGVPIAPERISLVYWHAQYPEELQPIGYSREEHQKARETLTEGISRIAVLEGEAAFPKTGDQEECRRCLFRTFCEIEVEPLASIEDGWEMEEEDGDRDLPPETEL